MFIIGDTEDSLAWRCSQALGNDESASLELVKGGRAQRASFIVHSADDEEVVVGLREMAQAAQTTRWDEMYLEFRSGQRVPVTDVRVDDFRGRIVFEDGSELGFIGEGGTRDDGPALLEPITLSEFEAIEAILALLWAAAADSRLTEAQERKIRSIAELIDEERRETVPAETKRWGLVAVVRRGLRGFMSGDDVLRNTLAWSQVVEILTKIDWHTIARSLPG